MRYIVPYVGLAGLLWLAVYESGVHATIAGVVLGFLTPAIAMQPRRATGNALASELEELRVATRTPS